jgi:hypothetical protein
MHHPAVGHGHLRSVANIRQRPGCGIGDTRVIINVIDNNSDRTRKNGNNDHDDNQLEQRKSPTVGQYVMVDWLHSYPKFP